MHQHDRLSALPAPMMTVAVVVAALSGPHNMCTEWSEHAQEAPQPRFDSGPRSANAVGSRRLDLLRVTLIPSIKVRGLAIPTAPQTPPNVIRGHQSTRAGKA